MREAGAPIDIGADAPFVVVLNHGSGKEDAATTRSAIEGVLRDAGRPHEVMAVEDASQLRAIADRAVARAREVSGVVVAAGGDGTISTVAQAMIDSGCPFGVLPQGTFNYFSRTHGIPSDAVEATRLLLTARAHPAQVGRVNDRIFLVNASLGLYPQLLEDREAFKKQLGRSRPVALLSALATLLRAPRQLRLGIEHEGRTRRVRTPTLVVGNNRLQLEQIGIPQAERIDGGLLAAIHLRPVGTLTLFWLLARGALGQLGEAEDVESDFFRTMVVKPRILSRAKRIKVAMDGEVTWMRPPLEFSALPGALMLLRPEDDAVVRE